jgi:hypothetical protein
VGVFSNGEILHFPRKNRKMNMENVIFLQIKKKKSDFPRYSFGFYGGRAWRYWVVDSV